jgi:hypothetical protein
MVSKMINKSRQNDSKKDFLVIWKIDLYADGPVHAAKLARQIQLDEDSTATVFEIFDDNSKLHEIDILGMDLDE